MLGNTLIHRTNLYQTTFSSADYLRKHFETRPKRRVWCGSKRKAWNLILLYHFQ